MNVDVVVPIDRNGNEEEREAPSGILRIDPTPWEISLHDLIHRVGDADGFAYCIAIDKLALFGHMYTLCSTNRSDKDPSRPSSWIQIAESTMCTVYVEHKRDIRKAICDAIRQASNGRVLPKPNTNDPDKRIRYGFPPLCARQVNCHLSYLSAALTNVLGDCGVLRVTRNGGRIPYPVAVQLHERAMLKNIDDRYPAASFDMSMRLDF